MRRDPRHRDEFPVRLMCRVLDVAVSGFYAYLKRPLSWRRVIDEVLMAHVRIAFAESRESYGAPRVLRELKAAGLPTSQKPVARLMREAGFQARLILGHTRRALVAGSGVARFRLPSDQQS